MVINTNNDLTAKTSNHSNHKVANTATSADRQGNKQTTVPSRDQVDLSQEAQTIKNLEAKAQSSEGVDTAKVEELRQRIASGDYAINSQSIAEKMIGLDN